MKIELQSALTKKNEDDKELGGLMGMSQGEAHIDPASDTQSLRECEGVPLALDVFLLANRMATHA